MKSANSKTNNQAGRLAVILLGALAFFGLYAAPVSALAADPPTLNLAQDPLYNGRGNVHPNLILDLSVEFPTVGAAYRTAYDRSKEYLGYFNAKKCYTYPTTITGVTHTDNSTGTAVVNTTSTPNATTVTTTTSQDGYTTVTTTTTDVVTSASPTYTATVWRVVTSGKLFNSSGSNRTAVYTTFNSSTGALGGPKYYCSSGCGSGGTNINSTTTLWTNPQTAVSTPQYRHTPTIAVTTTVGIPYPDLSENAYFSIHKDADSNHECGGDSFSGNFMNWASSSSIDMLRYALTGGDRVIDTASTTVLQRAYLPDGSYNSNSNFYASSTYFPRKSVANASTVTPFLADTLYVVSCRDRILFSNTSGGGSCDTVRVSGSGESAILVSPTDKYFGEYRARVKVCDSNEGAIRSDLCSKYGSNYKPEGTLQRYSDKIRAGAFGYLTGSHIDNLYGGVLRAPARYVGPKKFEAPSFTQVTNDKPEWNADTGVFYANPLNDSAGNSGVINYLNKFGRTNPNRLGAYKTLDPVSELYYESLRYLQGKQPTDDGSNTTSAIKLLGSNSSDDNFPVKKSWDDPITASCQNNYAVVIGDVNTHQDGYIPGSQAKGDDTTTRSADTASTQWPALDVSIWSQKVSNMEQNIPDYDTIRNPAPRSNLTGLDTSTSAGSNKGTYNFTGLAYWANTNDIRLDKPVRVQTFAIDVDEGGNGSIEDTNPRSKKPRNSQFYLAAKYGGFTDKGDRSATDNARKPDGNPFITLDTDGVTKLYNQSEWTGTNTGTDPKNYFLASQPEKLIAAIKDIFRVASSTSGTIGGVTLTSTNISTTSSAYVYQPGFDPSKWGGALLKLELKLVDGVVVVPSASAAAWDAGVVLTNAAVSSTQPATRKIYTSYVDPVVGDISSMEFKWGSLNSTQQAYLNKSPESPYAVDDLGEKRVNYLRGSRTDEIGQPNGIFRARDRVLGDIINSNPTYVGKPSPYISGDGYAAFRETYKNRAEAVYVGANDGMLHAVDAGDGTELFAYVPDAMLPNLNKLTNPAYVHQPYVDGMMNVTEVKVRDDWKTVLVSGMGAGTQGIFALDVSSPGNFAGGAMALWEFTDKNDPDMGNVFSRPVIAKFKRLGADNKPFYTTMVVVANGYNSSKDDSGALTYSCPEIGRDDWVPDAVCNAKGHGALFLLSLDKDKSEPWQRGVNYWKYPTPVLETSKANGLSAPALVAGRDGSIRYAYAGDLQGNLWRFDFTLPNAGNVSEPWDSVMPWAAIPANTKPLFTAKDGSNNLQPITQEPRVVYAPGTGYLVLFGTGKFVENADTSQSGTQSFYGIYDTTFNADRVTGRSQLAPRTVAAYQTGGVDAVTISGDPFDYGTTTGTKKGWYFDFRNSASTGERSVTNSTVAFGTIFFNTLSMSNPCEKGGGRAYSLCTLSGLPLTADGKCESGGVSGYLSTVGMLSSPILVTIADGTTVGDRDSIGHRVSSIKYSMLNFGTSGATSSALKTLTSQTGRASWREILNWQDLTAAAKAKKAAEEAAAAGAN